MTHRKFIIALLAFGFTSPAFATKGQTSLDYAPALTIEGNFLAAYVAGSLQDAAAASAYYGQLLKVAPRNPELLERAFVAFLADGDMSEAFRAAQKLLARESSNSLAHLALGVKALSDGQFRTARGQLRQGGRGRAADLTATLLTAWSYAGSGERRLALQTADRLQGERAFAVFRDYHAGLIAALTNQPREAEQRLKSAYEAEPTTLRIMEAYARFEAARGNSARALEVYKAFDKAAPRHPLVRDAIRKLERGERLEPLITNARQGAAEVLYGLGAAGTSQGDELAASIYLRLGLHLEPRHPLALVTLADFYDRLKRHDRAIDILKDVPVDSPLRPTADIQIGLGLEQLGKGEEAVKHLAELVQARPDDVEALTAYGNVLRARKRFEDAAQAYTMALEKAGPEQPGHWPLYYFRGASFERAKQWPKAEADLKKALALIPENQNVGRAQVLNYLGYSWVDQNINLDEAFKMLKKAVELAPRDGMIIDSLGWAYFRLGRYEDAVRELERAVELKPGDPVINDHLGDAYWKVGRTLEARFQWAHARDSNPEPDDLKKILHKLEHGLEEPKPPTAAAVPEDNGG